MSPMSPAADSNYTQPQTQTQIHGHAHVSYRMTAQSTNTPERQRRQDSVLQQRAHGTLEQDRRTERAQDRRDGIRDSPAAAPPAGEPIDPESQTRQRSGQRNMYESVRVLRIQHPTYYLADVHIVGNEEVVGIVVLLVDERRSQHRLGVAGPEHLQPAQCKSHTREPSTERSRARTRKTHESLNSGLLCTRSVIHPAPTRRLSDDACMHVKPPHSRQLRTGRVQRVIQRRPRHCLVVGHAELHTPTAPVSQTSPVLIAHDGRRAP